MADPTASSMILLSLKEAGIIGVGQQAGQEDMVDALTRLNWMLAQWRRKRWLVYRIKTIGVPSTGAQSYTVGPGGQYDTPVRPARIESAFLRQIAQFNPNQPDYPLELLTSRDDYNNIPLKSMGSMPQYLWYDNSYPQGLLYPWPVPAANIYAVFVSFMDELIQISDINDDLVLPEEYYAAINTNLAIILRDAYDLPPKPVLIARAKDSLNVLRGANAQISTLSMPNNVPGRNGLGYNIYTDR